ncbi:AAA family ATPase [Amycolatopsis rhizosphaerae]|uniref:AAA family ATPase n=1 Tax=Amycolatopsis rhizosphaerae TaxID=2053003 RepID=A0A558CBT6_9PSEU|nr:helix-turn-helix transcriptional regulator [Amycolatopsis rhizosphaerae]TVT46230.1 AAA family ATPase [Amycolatopsis rhizosphaerae]
MLYGRDEERAVIDGLLDAAAQGRSGVLVLTGEPGIGKSALLDYAASSARDARVLRASATESEAALPFAGLQLLLRSAGPAVDALPAVQAAAWRGAMGLAPAADADRFLVGLAALSLLSELASGSPLLCLVDDAQWLDTESAEALSFAARRLDAEGVVLLFGAREGSAFPSQGLPLRRLDGLDASASAELLDRCGGELSPQLRYRVLAEAGGNPLALLELPSALATADAAPPGGLPLTERMRAAFATQVRGLPGPTRTVLRVAAAEDTGELAVVLRAAAALGASVDDLTPAERAGLVRITGGTVAFRHPLLRAAVYQEVPLAERLRLHRALAEALDRAEDADRRAWHRAAAATGPDEEVAAELERTARRAGERSGHTAAAAAYERSVQLTPAPADRDRRLLLAAEAAGEAGAVDHALELASRVSATPEDPALRARHVQVEAFGRFWQGRQHEAYQLLVSGAAGLAGTDPHRSLETLVEAVYIAWFTGRRELADAMDRLAATPVPAGDRLRPMTEMIVGGLSLALARPADDGDLDTAFAEAVRSAAGDYRELLFVCGVQLTTGRDRQARELSETLVSQARARGSISRLPNLLFMLAETQLFQGRHRDAEASAGEALRIAVDADLRHWHGQLRGVLAHLAAIAGDETRCRELTEDVLVAPHDPGLPRARWALGLLDLGYGRAAAALDRLGALAGGPDAYGLSVLRSVPDLVEAAVRAGEPDRATEPLRRYTDWAHRTGQAWAEALVLRCQALLAPEGEADKHFRRALERHQDDPRPFESARTTLLYGEWLRRARRKAEASTHLRTAHADFERLGAAGWADRAAAELTATGVTGTTTAAPAGPAGTLTPQELQIVRLAGRGLSNKDIAAQLFLSPRTVGYHLYKAYPKLGVLSRGELAGLPLD